MGTAPVGGYTIPASDPSNLRPPDLCAYCGNPLGRGVSRKTKYHHDCYRTFNSQKTKIRSRLRRSGLPYDAKAVMTELAKTKPKVEDAAFHEFLATDLSEAVLLRLRLSADAPTQLQHTLVSTGLFREDPRRHPHPAGRLDDARRSPHPDLEGGGRPPGALRRARRPARADPREPRQLLHRNPPPKHDDGTWDETEMWVWANLGADRFIAFEHRHFRLSGKKLFIRKEFHRNWIVEMIYAMGTGGYLMILAPPRHGKSQLLVHFCVWAICRDPNIRILWVSSSQPLARAFTWAVAQVLATNDKLIAETCSPGEVYAPPKRGPGTTWAKGEFTVVDRDAVLVGATMTALGTNGSTLSRNADLIVGDDLESRKTVKNARMRRETRLWITQELDSRKEEHTALIYLGSRQDYDDFYGYQLNDPNFRSIVERAHDPTCAKPVHNLSVHTDCVLFPEVRSYRWLHSKMTGAEAMAGADDEDDSVNMFDLVYLNIARKAGATFFTVPMLAAARDAMRGIGVQGLPAGYTLVGGLDPSASGRQAAFCWALTPVKGLKVPYSDAYTNRLQYQDWAIKRWMVDLNNRVGGGVGAMLEQFDLWLALYGLRHWVVEDMAMQKAFTDDPRVKLWERLNEGRVESHATGTNKWDPKWGLGAMTRLYDEGLISTPYGTEEARRKTALFEAQQLSFDGNVETERQRRKDVHMASWFPQKVARRREKELLAAAAEAAQRETDVYSEMAYPNIDDFVGDLEL